MADATIRFNVEGHEDAQNAFSRIIQGAREAGEAVGGSSEAFGKLGELAGPLEGIFGRLSSVISPAGLGIAAVGVAAYEAGKTLFTLGEEATEAGSRIAKIAQIMNESAAPVSDLQYAWKSAGGEVDGLTKLVFMFEQRMETSKDKVGQGFKELGLDLNQFANASTSDKILAISDAMRNAGDGTNVAGAAFEVFGRGARESMSQLMGPLSEMANHSKEIGATWSDTDAKAALEFEHSLSALKTQTESTWIALGKDVAPVTEAVVYGFDRMKLAAANVAYDFVQLVTAGGYIPAILREISGAAEGLPAVAKNLQGVRDTFDEKDGAMFHLAAKSLNDYMTHASGAADLNADLSSKMAGADKELRDELRESHGEFVKQQAERKRVGEELQKVEGEFATDTMNWVDKVGNHRVEAIAGWKEGGAKAFDDMFKLEREYATGTMDWISKLANTRNDSDIKFAAQEAKTLTEAQRLWTDHYAFVESRGQSTSQRQITEVNRWYQNEVDKARQAGITDQIYYDGLAQTARDKMQAVRDEHDITFQAVKKMQDDLTIGWQQHFSDSLSKGDFSVKGFASAFEGVFSTMKDDVSNIFSGLLTNVISGFLQPLLDNVRNITSRISSMLVGALTGEGGGDGGPMSWFSGSVSGATPSLLGSVLGGSAFAGIGGGGGGVAFSATTGAVGTSGGIGGAITGAAGSVGSALGTTAAFLATNPIGWAIDAGIGIFALTKLLSGGPSDEEVAGRKVDDDWRNKVWSTLTEAERHEASVSGWANPMDAGGMISIRDTLLAPTRDRLLATQNKYASLQGRMGSETDPQAIRVLTTSIDAAQREVESAQADYEAAAERASSAAETRYSAITAAIVRGPDAVNAAIRAASIPSFDIGGIVPGPIGAPRAAIVHGGETVRTPRQEAALSMDAVHEQLVGLRRDLRSFMRIQPTMLRHALRGV